MDSNHRTRINLASVIKWCANHEVDPQITEQLPAACCAIFFFRHAGHKYGPFLLIVKYFSMHSLHNFSLG